MANNIPGKLKELTLQIENSEIPIDAKIVENWGGADVIICSKLDDKGEKWLADQPFVISSQSIEPKRRVVITKYSKELSWLFYQLKDIFHGTIDHISKYDFYGSLAQTAITFINNTRDINDANELLRAVLKTAWRFCNDEPTR